MMDIQQLGTQLGEYLYDCGVSIEQVQAIAEIVEQIRQCAYEQGMSDMRDLFFEVLGEHAAGIITENYGRIVGEPTER